MSLAVVKPWMPLFASIPKNPCTVQDTAAPADPADTPAPSPTPRSRNKSFHVHVFDVRVEICQSGNLRVVRHEQGVGTRGQQLLGHRPRYRQAFLVRRASTKLVDQYLHRQPAAGEVHAGYNAECVYATAFLANVYRSRAYQTLEGARGWCGA